MARTFLFLFLCKKLNFFWQKLGKIEQNRGKTGFFSEIWRKNRTLQGCTCENICAKNWTFFGKYLEKVTKIEEKRTFFRNFGRKIGHIEPSSDELTLCGRIFFKKSCAKNCTFFRLFSKKSTKIGVKVTFFTKITQKIGHYMSTIMWHIRCKYFCSRAPAHMSFILKKLGCWLDFLLKIKLQKIAKNWTFFDIFSGKSLKIEEKVGFFWNFTRKIGHIWDIRPNGFAQKLHFFWQNLGKSAYFLGNNAFLPKNGRENGTYMGFERD